MASRAAARRRPRGGGSIQASGQVRTRVATALAAVVVAAAVGAAVVLRAGAHERELLGLAGAAVLVLAVALAFGLVSLVPWPLVLLAGAYAWSLGGGDVDQWSPVFAAGFLAVAELAYWSLELRGRFADAERLSERRAGLVVALALGTVALGGLVLAATSLQLGSGVVLDLAGVAAAVAAVAVVAALARAR